MPTRPPIFRPPGVQSPEERQREYERLRRHDPTRRLYGTARWKRRRADQLAREPLCRRCLAQGRRTRATVANHIRPHRGDEILFWQGELESVCASCHSGVIQAEEIAAGKPPGG
jgi:5-methylcytosine-specific restriction enzyme A